MRSQSEEAVAVKELQLAGATPEQIADARAELCAMCAVSQQLAGYVVEIKVQPLRV